MGFLDYLDKIDKPNKNYKIKSKSHELIKEEVDDNKEIDDYKYIITDLGGSITFNENLSIKRFVVWKDSKIIDFCNDVDVLIEKYGEIDIISREPKNNNKFKIKEKVIRKPQKNIEESDTDLSRASLILEGLPEASDVNEINDLNNITNIDNNNDTEFRRPQDVSNHASKLL
ncbi:MAG: hypothetical protein ACOC33_03645 [bacterium]